MSWMRDLIWRILETIWPTPETVPQSQRDAMRLAEDQDVQRINNTSFAADRTLAIAQAHRIEQDEEDRRRTADAKASNFLLVLAALVPLLTYLETSIWEAKVGTAPRPISLLVLFIAIAYLAAAAFWALKTISGGVYHRIGVGDLVTEIAQKHPKENLAKQTLINARRNQNVINSKVSRVKMTHEFMLRGSDAAAAPACSTSRTGSGLVRVRSAWPSKCLGRW
jgi:hypothetical protein